MDFTYDDEQVALQEVGARRTRARESARPISVQPAGPTRTPHHARAVVDPGRPAGWTGLLGARGAGRHRQRRCSSSASWPSADGPDASARALLLLVPQGGHAGRPGPRGHRAAGRPGRRHHGVAPSPSANRATGAPPRPPCGPWPAARDRRWVLNGEKPIVVDGHTRPTGSSWRPGTRTARSSYLARPPGGELVPSLDPHSASWPASSSMTRRSLPGSPAATRAGLCAAGAGRHRHRCWPPRPSARPTGALAEAIAYTSERVVFDKPVATYQTVRHRLVEMFQQVEMAQCRLPVRRLGPRTPSRPSAQQAAATAASAYAGRGRGAGHRRRHPSCTVASASLWANDAHFLFKLGEAEREVLTGGSGRAVAPPGLKLFVESAWSQGRIGGTW